uniref:Fringe-like glycosyltransferase domain-containing protein n=1 Tax=Ficedula albicollis TaxID=59894 RepID=A0A803V712_FICAL
MEHVTAGKIRARRELPPAPPSPPRPPAEDISPRDVFIAVKTTKKFHKARLELLLDTWISRNRDMVRDGDRDADGLVPAAGRDGAARTGWSPHFSVSDPDLRSVGSGFQADLGSSHSEASPNSALGYFPLSTSRCRAGLSFPLVKLRHGVEVQPSPWVPQSGSGPCSCAAQRTFSLSAQGWESAGTALHAEALGLLARDWAGLE